MWQIGEAGGEVVDHVEEMICEVNRKLKAGCLGVSILRRNSKLYLRSSRFPAKPGSDRPGPYRQELPLDCNANPAGVVQAHKKALLIAGQLASHAFDWSDHVSICRRDTVADWVEVVRKDVLARCKPIVWDKDYRSVYCKLPQAQPLTVAMLLALIESTAINSRSRKRTVVACRRLAREAKLEGAEFHNMMGKYGIRSTAPRVIPSDDEIIKIHQTISNERDRWVFGMMATYGLRPHELFAFDRLALGKDPSRVCILDGTKTNSRMQWALPFAWVDRFELTKVPEFDSRGRDNSIRGQLISCWFRRHGIPFKPYCLRHAWAIRAIHAGLNDSIAAKMMGHSLEVHCRVYQHWLNERDFAKAVEGLML